MLHHLLRLSALPRPIDQKEETAMLQTLQSQIHFLQEIQRVDTTGVPPLRSIRDESPESLKEYTIGLDDLEDAMAKEQVIGRRRRIKRVSTEKTNQTDGLAGNGDVLGSASKTVGNFFVVQLGN
jgi:Asp-tRNA(Asn)/Glu-tRNA(Gln) amidotransferase C subunit